MISSGKNDLLTTLMSQALWYGYLRTGRPEDCPKTYMDMVGSSVASFQLDRVDRTPQFQISLTNRLCMQPIGGYGEGRLLTVDNNPVQTYLVQPQFIRSYCGDTQARNAPLITQGQSILSAGYLNNVMSLYPNASIEYDFGRQLRFRAIASYAVAVSGINPQVQYWNGSAWVSTNFAGTTAASPTETAVDFTAQKIRLFNPTGSSTVRQIFAFWAEKGTAFAATPITHMVIVPAQTALLANQTDNTYVDPSVGDYFSLIADVGTDFYLDTLKTGQYVKPIIGDISIPFAQPLMKEVV